MKMEEVRPAWKLRRFVLAVGAALAGNAHAMQLGDNPDLAINFDNTVNYNFGVRTQGIDPKIGNNPVFQNSDYKFPHAGDVITNRVGWLSEFDVSYRNQFGFRVSGNAWKDFAYSDTVATNPGFFVPGAVPYSALSSYSTGTYSSYTKKYHVQGADLLDAFVFANFELGDRPASVRLGRHNIYWGNALFAGSQAISYSQGPVDGIKGAASPGTTVKELFLPRNQISATYQLSDDLSVAGQYFFEFRPNRLPEGGTFDGAADFLFRGADRIPFPSVVPRGSDVEPKDVNNNFGLALRWTPSSKGINLGAYFRQFDEVMPWAPLVGLGPTGSEYHLAYAQKTKLIGLSLDMPVGHWATGMELSYRMNSALNGTTGPVPTNLRGTEGPRGDVINFVANGMIGLTPTPLWQTGTFIVEFAATYLTGVSSGASLFKGEGYGGCVGLSKDNGCSTRSSTSLAVQFTPQWLQVLPGVDLSMPTTFRYGLTGSNPIVGASGNGGTQGTYVFSLGLQAVYRSRYNFTLAYSGQRGKVKTEAALPNGSSIYSNGRGTFLYNDRDRVTLTFQTTF